MLLLAPNLSVDNVMINYSVVMPRVPVDSASSKYNSILSLTGEANINNHNSYFSLRIVKELNKTIHFVEFDYVDMSDTNYCGG